MPAHEHCAKCDKSLGKRGGFVSVDGQSILCARCFGVRRVRGESDKAMNRRKRLGLNRSNRRLV